MVNITTELGTLSTAETNSTAADLAYRQAEARLEGIVGNSSTYGISARGILGRAYNVLNTGTPPASLGGYITDYETAQSDKQAADSVLETSKRELFNKLQTEVRTYINNPNDRRFSLPLERINDQKGRLGRDTELANLETEVRTRMQQTARDIVDEIRRNVQTGGGTVNVDNQINTAINTACNGADDAELRALVRNSRQELIDLNDRLAKEGVDNAAINTMRAALRNGSRNFQSVATARDTFMADPNVSNDAKNSLSAEVDQELERLMDRAVANVTNRLRAAVTPNINTEITNELTAQTATAGGELDAGLQARRAEFDAVVNEHDERGAILNLENALNDPARNYNSVMVERDTFMGRPYVSDEAKNERRQTIQDELDRLLNTAVENVNTAIRTGGAADVDAAINAEIAAQVGPPPANNPELRRRLEDHRAEFDETLNNREETERTDNIDQFINLTSVRHEAMAPTHNALGITVTLGGNPYTYNNMAELRQQLDDARDNGDIPEGSNTETIVQQVNTEIQNRLNTRIRTEMYANIPGRPFAILSRVEAEINRRIGLDLLDPTTGGQIIEEARRIHNELVNAFKATAGRGIDRPTWDGLYTNRNSEAVAQAVRELEQEARDGNLQIRKDLTTEIENMLNQPPVNVNVFNVAANPAVKAGGMLVYLHAQFDNRLNWAESAFLLQNPPPVEGNLISYIDDMLLEYNASRNSVANINRTDTFFGIPVGRVVDIESAANNLRNVLTVPPLSPVEQAIIHERIDRARQMARTYRSVSRFERIMKNLRAGWLGAMAALPAGIAVGSPLVILLGPMAVSMAKSFGKGNIEAMKKLNDMRNMQLELVSAAESVQKARKDSNANSEKMLEAARKHLSTVESFEIK